MIKVYADTSVFGGVFDPEFSKPSKQFFEEVDTGRFVLVISAIVEAERKLNRHLRIFVTSSTIMPKNLKLQFLMKQQWNCKWSI